VIWRPHSDLAPGNCAPLSLLVTPQHRIMTFDTLLINNLYRFLRCASSSNFFIRSLHISDAFFKYAFFLNYSRFLYDGEQLTVVDALYQCTRLISIVLA